MFYKKIIIGLFLIQAKCAFAENMLSMTMQQTTQQQSCRNCTALAASVSCIMRTFTGDLRFYHLQSQYGEAVSRQRCYCFGRPAIVSALRQELVQLRSKVSQDIIKELRDIGEFHYERELTSTR